MLLGPNIKHLSGPFFTVFSAGKTSLVGFQFVQIRLILHLSNLFRNSLKVLAVFRGYFVKGVLLKFPQKL